MAQPRRPKKVQTKPISKKRKFVKDGVFYAELNDFLARELAEDGYAGCEVRVTPTRTEVIIRATRPRAVVGDNGRRVREITALVQKRFKYTKGSIILFAEKIPNKGLSALSQAQAVKFRLLQGLSVRRAAYSVVKFIMEKGAKGCEVTVSGKLRGQRAKAMKFRDGYMIHAGDATNYYIQKAVKHVHLRQGVIGIKVKIMLPHDPKGVEGVEKDLPDAITIHEPKEESPPIDKNIYESTQLQQFGGQMGMENNNNININDSMQQQPPAQQIMDQPQQPIVAAQPILPDPSQQQPMYQQPPPPQQPPQQFVDYNQPPQQAFNNNDNNNNNNNNNNNFQQMPQGYNDPNQGYGAGQY